MTARIDTGLISV